MATAAQARAEHLLPLGVGALGRGLVDAGRDQEQQTFYAQLYGQPPEHLGGTYPEWMYAASPTESGIEYGPDYPALTMGEVEGELLRVGDLVRSMLDYWPRPVWAQLYRDQARGEAALGLQPHQTSTPSLTAGLH